MSSQQPSVVLGRVGLHSVQSGACLSRHQLCTVQQSARPASHRRHSALMPRPATALHCAALHCTNPCHEPHVAFTLHAAPLTAAAVLGCCVSPLGCTRLQCASYDRSLRLPAPSDAGVAGAAPRQAWRRRRLRSAVTQQQYGSQATTGRSDAFPSALHSPLRPLCTSVRARLDPPIVRRFHFCFEFRRCLGHSRGWLARVRPGGGPCSQCHCCLVHRCTCASLSSLHRLRTQAAHCASRRPLCRHTVATPPANQAQQRAPPLHRCRQRPCCWSQWCRP